MAMTYAAAEAIVAAQYANTHARLRGDQTYDDLKSAAAREALDAPDSWLARNRLALHVEINTPML